MDPKMKTRTETENTKQNHTTANDSRGTTAGQPKRNNRNRNTDTTTRPHQQTEQNEGTNQQKENPKTQPKTKKTILCQCELPPLDPHLKIFLLELNHSISLNINSPI